ncbi:peptide chain release factor N(5)-glutamine methyltransferase [Membranihabitans marinus]|uniref:peptide chain release factor N(5)-glutamine methyltransferase n=1 Tax=Membranihabitans marinus TaxID=1227546 RepID=UPI001F00D123|nr:peptide chain release factor N(5)-glutamine methyltransferase [Membranihabitans marinus]
MDEDKRYQYWRSALSPLYGDRETENMWRMYVEVDRPEDIFDADIEQLKSYFPLQYLLGFTWFYDLKIGVTPEVLIPRPETEELVFYLLDMVGMNDHAPIVLDLGTGSGCIPLAIKSKRPEWQLYGLDYYSEALEVAKKNSLDLDIDVKWCTGNILTWDLGEFQDVMFDIIISNPPYIPLHDQKIMADNVLKYEPHSALFTDHPQGLEFYQAIAENYSRNLKSDGWIFMEIHESYAEEILSLFHPRHHWGDIGVLNDLQGKPRIFYAQKKC